MASPRRPAGEQRASAGGRREAVTQFEEREPILDALGAKPVVGASAEPCDVEGQVADLVAVDRERELASVAPLGDVREGRALAEVEAQSSFGTWRIERERARHGQTDREKPRPAVGEIPALARESGEHALRECRNDDGR